MNDDWRAFAEHDRRLTAPPELEARVHAAIGLPLAHRRRRRLHPWLTAAAAAAVVAIATWPDRSVDGRSLPLQARAFAASPLPSAVAAVPARVHVGRAVEPARPQTIAEPEVIVMFDFSPPLETEPLQLVRLRVPREALQGLGVPLLEPDAAGMVDLDVLIGSDGLPRNIRRVRTQQEER